MMQFIYDSLDTVKRLKHPTKKDFIRISISIFVTVAIAALFFVFADTIFAGLYKWFYSIMK